MTVLGIDTYRTATSVALVGDGVEPLELREDGCAHNELILDMLARLLQARSTGLGQLGGIGVLVGPGMFTSLRVGLSVAKAVSETHRVPLKGINTLEAFAHAVDAEAGNTIVALDARKGQIYAAIFSGDSTILRPSVLRPAELKDHTIGKLMPGRVAVVGDAAGIALAELHSLGIGAAARGSGVLGGLAVGNLALEYLRRGPGDDPAELAPFYIRKTDAELARGDGQRSLRSTRDL
ncbi:MAG: tRNA (adenosine(37)-N6)-threonylcarbamoyltransferase complex dimerization subunit type 1 TsaB [candidate division WOR-3 bacterium]|nr:MAG: tRNA (adenosine(37)-N6)-threonylcarbamoyltransferase complex dimerization subunit type 1 TsaB [candidate division WOR-3 bacterium]